MKSKLFYILICFILFSCEKINQSNKSKIIKVKEKNATPTVDIESYNLILNSVEDRKTDVQEILRIKGKWPQIMQSPTFAGFDTILSKDFTFGNNFSVSINTDSAAEADKLFAGLSAGGNVIMPMEKTFWGAYFLNVYR